MNEWTRARHYVITVANKQNFVQRSEIANWAEKKKNKIIK